MTQVSRDGFHGSSTERASSVLLGWERWLRPWPCLSLAPPFSPWPFGSDLPPSVGPAGEREAAVYHLQMWQATPAGLLGPQAQATSIWC